MDDNGGCLIALIVFIAICAGIQWIIDHVVPALVAAMPALLLIAIIAGIVFGSAVLLDQHRNLRDQIAANHEVALIKQSEAERARRTEIQFREDATKAKAHYDAIEVKDGAAKLQVLQTIREHFKVHIGLSPKDADGKRYPMVSWKGAPDVQGELHIYRGPRGLLRSWSDVEKEIGDSGRIAIKSLSRDGHFKHYGTSPGATHCFYVYWSVPYQGSRPAVDTYSDVTEDIRAEDIRAAHRLTTLPYSARLKGGFRSVELSVPGAMDPLAREERELDVAERRAVLKKRWAALGEKKSPLEDPRALVNEIAESVLNEEKYNIDLQSAFEAKVAEIESDPTLSEEDKQQVIEALQMKISQHGEDQWQNFED